MEDFIAAVLAGVVGFVFLVLLAVLMGFPTMWTWNYVMPYLFELKSISVWHAIALNYLAGSFIKSSLIQKKK